MPVLFRKSSVFKKQIDHLMTGVGDIPIYSTFFSHTFPTTPGFFFSKMTNTALTLYE
jgi:hypothetical protein